MIFAHTEKGWQKMENEKRLIDYQKAIEIALDTLRGKVTTVTAVMLTTRLKGATVDAVEVVHAEWLDGWGVNRVGEKAYDSIDCSHCEEIFKIESRTREYWKARFKACPFCGAKMDGGNEDV